MYNDSTSKDIRPSVIEDPNTNNTIDEQSNCGEDVWSNSGQTREYDEQVTDVSTPSTVPAGTPLSEDISKVIVLTPALLYGPRMGNIFSESSPSTSTPLTEATAEFMTDEYPKSIRERSISATFLDDSEEKTNSKMEPPQHLTRSLLSRSTDAFDDPSSNSSSTSISDNGSSSSTNSKWKRFGDLKINKDLFRKGIVMVETCNYFASPETYESRLLDSPILTCLQDDPAFPINFRKLCHSQNLKTTPRHVCDDYSFSVGSRTLTFSSKAALIEKSKEKGTKTTKAFIKNLNKTVSLLNEFKKYVKEPINIPGLQYTIIPGDGHCLYNAVALYLGTDVTTLRQEVADYIATDPDKYRDVIEVDTDRTTEQYIEDVRNNTEWAGDLEINILMRIYNRPIYVVDPSGNIINRANEVDVDGEPIFVYYNGYNHYDGLVRIEGFTSEQILETLLTTNGQQSALSKTKTTTPQTKSSHDFEQEQDFVIANSTRREEVFFPLVVRNNLQNLGFYVYPWLSTNNAIDFQKFIFSGFKRFVTVGCMFGSTLKGIDQHGARLDLIKHDIEFHPLQKIVTIEYSHSSNQYEEVMFNELEKLLMLINHLSDKSTPRQLYYHLPYYDYMLFGIELFIRGRMELAALEQFFKAIILKTVEHVNRIKEICKRHAIHCIIRSPFENLFGRLKFKGEDIKFHNIARMINEDPKKISIVEMILPALGTLGEHTIDLSNESDDLSGIHSKAQEKLLVHHCLKQLQENNLNIRHKQVWNDYIRILGKEINTLDDLFRAANAIVVLLASQGEENYKVCSILPFSEKQIQVSYEAFCKKAAEQEPDKYPVIVNLTTIDAILAYDHNRQGLLFYYGSSADSLNHLVTERDILTAAHANIASNAYNQDSIEIEQVLTMFKKFKL